jgi:hypothetical protein
MLPTSLRRYLRQADRDGLDYEVHEDGSVTIWDDRDGQKQ